MRPLISAFLDVLYPPLCIGCGLRVRPHDVLCVRCIREMLNLPLSMEVSTLHLASLACACDATMMLVGWEYEDGGVLERCIHAMKYRRLHQVGEWLGRLLGEGLVGNPLLDHNPATERPLLLPVPLHRIKRIERGYNQADAICRGLAYECELEWDHNLLLRTRYTTSQSASRLDRDERQANVRKAFTVNGLRAEQLRGRPLIIVDDLVTTGATIGACVDVLIQSGFSDVRILAVARPPRH
ncbi:MAG: ComF family protein [Bacteroidetes bacterium]|nr:ComF family protein [Bacteroidota bacterium]